MKKVNLFTVVSFLFLLIFSTACQQKTKETEQNKTKSMEEKTSVLQKEGAVCYANNGRPGNMLTYQEIVPMLKQYDKTRSQWLKKQLGKEDTRINTYSIEELRDYLAYIEVLCKKKGIPLTAINIISSSYPEKYPQKPEYANKQTLIFMPVTKIDGENVTFDPLQSKKGKPVTFKQLLAEFDYDWKYDARNVKTTPNPQKAGMFSFDLQKELLSSGSNRSNLVPPPY